MMIFCRANNPTGMPPRPPTRPLHTLSTGDMSARLDVEDSDGQYEVMTSPTYVDPKELNTKEGEENVYNRYLNWCNSHSDITGS